MIIWTIIRWLFVIIWWLFDSNYLWLFVIIWEMIICDYLMIIWYWLFVIIWSKLFVIIWWLFAILLLRSLSVASGWVDERRSCRGICCLLPFSAATISLSFWACLYCEQQTISEPWSDRESDTKSLEGLASALAAAPALRRDDLLGPGPWTPTSDWEEPSTLACCRRLVVEVQVTGKTRKWSARQGTMWTEST